MKTKANELFNHASKKLNEASNELYKPEEDVVTFAVCKNSQIVIEDYLKGFLYDNGTDPSPFKTIESLYQQCKIVNSKFEKINLSKLNCKVHEIDSRYCNEISKVSTCYELADNLDTFLRTEKIIS